MSRAPKTLMEIFYVRTNSFRDTAKLYKLCSNWAAAEIYLGKDELGIEEFVHWAADGVQSRAETHRQLALFRKAFPGHRDPNKVVRDFELTRFGAKLKPTSVVPSAAVPA